MAGRPLTKQGQPVAEPYGQTRECHRSCAAGPCRAPSRRGCVARTRGTATRRSGSPPTARSASSCPSRWRDPPHLTRGGPGRPQDADPGALPQEGRHRKDEQQRPDHAGPQAGLVEQIVGVPGRPTAVTGADRGDDQRRRPEPVPSIAPSAVSDSRHRSLRGEPRSSDQARTEGARCRRGTGRAS